MVTFRESLGPRDKGTADYNDFEGLERTKTRRITPRPNRIRKFQGING